MTVRVRLVVGVLVRIFTARVRSLGTVRKEFFSIVEIEVSVSAAMIAISDVSVAIIVAVVVTVFVVGDTMLVVDNIVVVSLGVSLGDIDILVVLGNGISGLSGFVMSMRHGVVSVTGVTTVMKVESVMEVRCVSVVLGVLVVVSVTVLAGVSSVVGSGVMAVSGSGVMSVGGSGVGTVVSSDQFLGLSNCDEGSDNIRLEHCSFLFFSISRLTSRLYSFPLTETKRQ